MAGHLHPRHSVGWWDLQVSLAMAHNWTPQQINQLDPEYVEELFRRHAAESRYQKWKAKQGGGKGY